MICVLFEIVCTLQIDFSFLPTRRKETSKLGLSTTISQSLLRTCLSVENFQIQILINLVMPHYLQYTAIPQKRTIVKLILKSESISNVGRISTFLKEYITNPFPHQCVLLMCFCLEFIVVFFIPFSMSKKVGSMC